MMPRELGKIILKSDDKTVVSEIDSGAKFKTYEGGSSKK